MSLSTPIGSRLRPEHSFQPHRPAGWRHLEIPSMKETTQRSGRQAQGTVALLPGRNLHLAQNRDSACQLGHDAGTSDQRAHNSGCQPAHPQKI